MKKSLQSENVNSSNLIKTIAGKSLPMHWLSTNFGKLEAIHRPMGSHCPSRGAAVKSNIEFTDGFITQKGGAGCERDDCCQKNPSKTTPPLIETTSVETNDESMLPYSPSQVNTLVLTQSYL